VVIGKPGKNIPRDKALDHVLGYTCANDVSARDHQIKLGGGQWCRQRQGQVRAGGVRLLGRSGSAAAHVYAQRECAGVGRC